LATYGFKPVTWGVQMRDCGRGSHQVFDPVAEELVTQDGAQLFGHVSLKKVAAVVGRMKGNLESLG